MAIITYLYLGTIFLSTVLAGSLKDIKHVVLFMQENRAFDHVSPRIEFIMEAYSNACSILEPCQESEVSLIQMCKSIQMAEQHSNSTSIRPRATSSNLTTDS